MHTVVEITGLVKCLRNNWIFHFMCFDHFHLYAISGHTWYQIWRNSVYFLKEPHTHTVPRQIHFHSLQTLPNKGTSNSLYSIFKKRAWRWPRADLTSVSLSLSHNKILNPLKLLLPEAINRGKFNKNENPSSHVYWVYQGLAFFVRQYEMSPNKFNKFKLCILFEEKVSKHSICVLYPCEHNAGSWGS